MFGHAAHITAALFLHKKKHVSLIFNDEQMEETSKCIIRKYKEHDHSTLTQRHKTVIA